MRTRAALAFVALVLAGCAGIRSGTADPDPVPAPDGVVLFGTADGVLSVDAGSGSVVFQQEGAPALGDWSTLFSTSDEDSRTVLETHDAATGDVVSRVPIPDGFEVRVGAIDGSRVALMPALAEGEDPWQPQPRASTEIVVADPSGATEPRRYELEGNYDPEAFSADGRQLFLLQYLPPMNPAAYRVARLDLSRSRVFPVFVSHTKQLVETMSGTRLEQLASPTGDMLFTLYTSAPPSYSGHSADGADPVAFVHVLNLRDASAHCIALPRGFWDGDPSFQAMALSPEAPFLYVVDTQRGLVAEIGTRAGKLLRSAEIDFGHAGSEAQAAMSDGGTLFVANGSSVVTVDATTLTAAAHRPIDGAVTGLGRGADGIYVATPDGVEVIEPASGEATITIPSPSIDDIDYIGSVGS